MTRNLPLKAGIAAGALLGVTVASAAVVQTSKAAFSGTTDNGTNTFGAGTVSLTDDRASAMFAVADWKPGDSAVRCIQVTYTGSIVPSAPVTLYATVSDTDGGGGGTGAPLTLSDDLDVTVTVFGAGQTCTTSPATKTTIYASGTPAGSGGTLGELPAAYASGLSSGWTPAATNEMRAFEFTVTLGTDTNNDAQGDSATATFFWEARS